MKQAELRTNYPNFFARTALHLKNIFHSDAAKEQRDETEK